jgi:rod shape determining protein RodA
MIIVTAYFLEAVKNKEMPMLKGFLYIGLVDGIPLLLIWKQPDFGTMMVIIFSLFCMIYVWGVKYRYLFLGISVVIVGVIPILWNFIFTSVQKSRILSFVFAGSDPSGEYNLVQAKTAIASGGLIGNQTGEIVSVPVKWSDFIYTAISEHMGFIGTTTVILLSFFFLTRCVFVAAKATQKSYTYTVIGLTGAFAFHFIENMGMSVGLLPITGIPLPFISLGGSALLVNFISFGIILNISMERTIERK